MKLLYDVVSHFIKSGRSYHVMQPGKDLTIINDVKPTVLRLKQGHTWHNGKFCILRPAAALK